MKRMPCSCVSESILIGKTRLHSVLGPGPPKEKYMAMYYLHTPSFWSNEPVQINTQGIAFILKEMEKYYGGLCNMLMEER